MPGPAIRLEAAGVTTTRNGVPVDEYLRVKDLDSVWALGDCAAIRDRQSGKLYPPTAQHALRQGKVVAHNVIAAVRGAAKKPFVFSTIGQLAAIGRRTGVANILGVNFSGFIAWWMWRTIYLSKLPRLEKKVRVALGDLEKEAATGKPIRGRRPTPGSATPSTCTSVAG